MESNDIKKLNILRDFIYKNINENYLYYNDNKLSFWPVISYLISSIDIYKNNKRADINKFNTDKFLEPESINENLYFNRSFEKNIKNTVEDKIATSIICLLYICGLKNMDCEIKNKSYIDDNIILYENETYTESIFEICKLCYEDLDDSLHKDILCNILAFCEKLKIDIFWYINQKIQYIIQNK